MRRRVLSAAAGMFGGFIGIGAMGLMFSAGPVQRILYDPALQSRLFLDITPHRDILASVAGLAVLSAIHGWLYAQFAPLIPGRTVWQKGARWGIVIFAMYWLPQEWFVYHTLLGEPLILNLLELGVLLVGSVLEGVVIARCLAGRPQGTPLL